LGERREFEGKGVMHCVWHSSSGFQKVFVVGVERIESGKHCWSARED